VRVIRNGLAWCGLALLLALGSASPVFGQAMPGAAMAGQSSSASAPAGGEDRPEVPDSTVGYIDPAIPRNLVRFRVDDARDNITPSRADFFYAHTQPDGRGLPQDESKASYEDLSLYVETLVNNNLSLFAEVPFRFAQFQINGDHQGLGDINFGFKWAFLRGDDTVVSFQFRTYVPTAAQSRGLGTGHSTLEPAFLLYHQLTEQLALEGEFRGWIPLAGTPGVAGSVIRYGLGLHYSVYQDDNWTIGPVVETVGWTFLHGETDVGVGPSEVEENSAGETIVNIKAGLRVKLNNWGDLYAGYGRAVTGSVLYKDIYRVELRWFY
jgi:hypothetical protein